MSAVRENQFVHVTFLIHFFLLIIGNINIFVVKIAKFTHLLLKCMDG